MKSARPCAMYEPRHEDYHMIEFKDAAGADWVATAVEEDTPRHHGRWHMVFHPAGDRSALHPVGEVRWQTRATAERTLRTMSAFELRRRLGTARARRGHHAKADPGGSFQGPPRARTSASAG